MIKEGARYSVHTKTGHKFIGEFVATQDMCAKMLTRLLLFKFKVEYKNVYIKKEK